MLYNQCCPGERFYMWFVSPTAPQLDPTTVTEPGFTNVSPPGWAGVWTLAFDVASNVTPGTYSILGHDILILPPSTGVGTSYIAPGLPSTRIRDRILAAFASGNNVRFLPGVHFLDFQIGIPDKTEIDATGATIYCQPTGAYSEKIFTPQGAFTITGGKWYLTNYLIHSEFPIGGRQLIIDAEFVGGRTGDWSGSYGLAYRNCRFTNTILGIQGSGHTVVHRCIFEGQDRLCAIFSYNGHFLVFECEFYGTRRGVVVQSGSASEFMVLENKFRHIRSWMYENAGECILMETGAGSAERWAIVSNDITDSDGPGIIMYGANIRHGTIANNRVDTDNSSILMYGPDTPVDGQVVGWVENIDIYQCEVRQVCIYGNVRAIDGLTGEDLYDRINFVGEIRSGNGDIMTARDQTRILGDLRNDSESSSVP